MISTNKLATRIRRTLVDQVIYGFLAMDLEERKQTADRLNVHFAELAHSDAIRWKLTEENLDA